MVWQFLINLNMHLPSNPAIALWGICPRKMKIGSHKILLVDVHNSSVSDSPQGKARQISSSEWRFKQTDTPHTVACYSAAKLTSH